MATPSERPACVLHTPTGTIPFDPHKPLAEQLAGAAPRVSVPVNPAAVVDGRVGPPVVPAAAAQPVEQPTQRLPLQLQPATADAAVQSACPDPQVSIELDLPQFGTLRLRYHRVIVAPPQIVLVFDTRYRASVDYTPPANTGVSMTLRVADAMRRQQSYTVVSPGLEFVDRDCRYTMLLISPQPSVPEVQDEEDTDRPPVTSGPPAIAEQVGDEINGMLDALGVPDVSGASPRGW